MTALLKDTKKALFFIFLSVIFISTVHLFIWWHVCYTNETINWLTLLSNWDSGHFADLSLNGYGGYNWAWLPLYPLLLAFISKLLSIDDLSLVSLVGTLTSYLIFLVWIVGISAIIIYFARDRERESNNFFLLPQSYLGWLFFIFSPASYVFHSNHTESLFLILSYFAIFFVFQGKWKLASLLAGLSALTRNQGVFVIISVAWLSALKFRQIKSKINRFILCCIIAVPWGLSYVFYQYLATGDPLMSVNAQQNWNHATSFYSVLKTFWFGNEWQGFSLGSALHHLLFYVLIYIGMRIWKYCPPLSFYIIMSIICEVPKGELANVFRYSAVLFPAWFWLGDRVDKIPLLLKYGSLALLVALNCVVTQNFALARWAY